MAEQMPKQTSKQLLEQRGSETGVQTEAKPKQNASSPSPSPRRVNSPSTPPSSTSTREPRSEVDGWLGEIGFLAYEAHRAVESIPFTAPEVFVDYTRRLAAAVGELLALCRRVTGSPVGCSGVSGPVDGRSVGEIRADLSVASSSPLHRMRTGVYEGSPRTADAIVRLLADVPQLLAEVEAAHRFEVSAAAESAGLANRLNGVAAERDALLGEVERLRAAVGTAENMLDWRLDALIAARKAWSASVVRGVAAEDERAEWYEAHEVRVEEVLRQRERAEAAESEVRSLRGVVQAVEALHRKTTVEGYDADCMGGGCDHDDDMAECPIRSFDVCGHCYELIEQTGFNDSGECWPADLLWPCPTARALAAAADAPQPPPEIGGDANPPMHDWQGFHCQRCRVRYYDAAANRPCPGPSPAVLPEKEQRDV